MKTGTGVAEARAAGSRQLPSRSSRVLPTAITLITVALTMGMTGSPEAMGGETAEQTSVRQGRSEAEMERLWDSVIHDKVQDHGLEFPAVEGGADTDDPGTWRPPSPGIASHTVLSHLSILTRPVSSALKLLSVMTSAGLDDYVVVGPLPQGSLPPLSEEEGMDLDRWEEELDEITDTKSTPGNIRLLIDGEEFFPRLEEAIAAAGESVDLQIYIYDNDDYALQFSDLIRERSKDLDVRIIFDGLGSILARGVYPKSIPDDHRPPASMSDYLREGSNVRVRRLANPWFTFNHTKSIIVDSGIAFLGGMNIGREYRYDWHDLMFEVHGPVIGPLGMDFESTWAYSGLLGDLSFLLRRSYRARVLPGERYYPVRILRTTSRRAEIYLAQIAAVQRARKFIYIENPYISDDRFLSELIRARRRGVDVRVVIPFRANWPVMQRSNLLAANTMLENGIKVYLYPRMSHLKAAVYDGWVCLGSANLDKGSLRFNREINMATSDPEVTAEVMERIFDKDFEESTLMTDPRDTRWIDLINELLADLL